MNTPTTIETGRRHRSGVGVTVERAGLLAVAAIAGWSGVGASRVWDSVGDDGEGASYASFSIALVLATALMVAAAWSASRATDRTTLRRVGLGIGVVAMASTLVAWATPLWMTTIAISLAVFAVVTTHRVRTGLAAVAIAQVLGVAVTFVATEAEIGTRDEYGDYPAAFVLGVVVAAAGSAIGLIVLARAARRSEAPW